MVTKKATTKTSDSHESKKEEQVLIPSVTEERIVALEDKLNNLINILNTNPNVTSNCPKNQEGIRQIIL